MTSRIYFENTVAPVSYLKMNIVSEFYVSQGLTILLVHLCRLFFETVLVFLTMLRRFVILKMKYRSQTCSLNS